MSVNVDGINQVTIEQLEAENVELAFKVQEFDAENKDTLLRLEKLQTENKRLQAVVDKRAFSPCASCVHVFKPKTTSE